MKRPLAAIAMLLVAALPLGAVEMGDDGLHKPDWFRDTFKDLQEDAAEAADEGKRLVLIIEQRGCVYCRDMHENTICRSARRCAFARSLLPGADQPARRH